MKPYLAILLIVFISINAHGSRVKRGLSADEQKKFLEELNKDRKKIADEVGFKFVPMKYNASHENEIVSGKECSKYRQQLPLRINDVAEEIRRHFINGGTEGDIYDYFFWSNVDKIGCSKEAKCTEVLEKHNETPLELQGKTIEYYGLCALRSNEAIVEISEAQFRKLKKAKTPSPNKYGDILGIPRRNQGSGMDGTATQGSGVEMPGKDGADGEQESGAGSVFSLTISLFLVLYI
ncbi:hypothetical protein CAEBREN_19834 [Caenorhabditis brenneri]|uniref:Uncharacterized protein n=1 Tax=Caenorhabditis brenneri TaxID=135651 RepID=G0N7E0_CAEBE|nr:hypothetical protein CAEBREN_19834 [Caenorhabditis brenneri]